MKKRISTRTRLNLNARFDGILNWRDARNEDTFIYCLHNRNELL